MKVGLRSHNGAEERLLFAVRNALARNEKQLRERAEIEAVRGRVGTLTEREFEVMRHVIAGELNKKIGERLGVVEKTIKVHRGRLMKKMGVRSVAELANRSGMSRAGKLVDAEAGIDLDVTFFDENLSGEIGDDRSFNLNGTKRGGASLP